MKPDQQLNDSALACDMAIGTIFISLFIAYVVHCLPTIGH
jgi:hypothetical protein